jgi:hypothetical protein
VQKQRKKRRPIIVDEDTNEEEEEYDEDSLYYDSEEEAYVERRPQKRCTEVFSRKAKPASPLSLELERADWPSMFKLPASLLGGESDPRQFLHKYTVAISLGGGDDVAMARAMIMA